MGGKVCSTCRKEKTFSEMTLDIRRSDGMGGRCLDCHNKVRFEKLYGISYVDFEIIYEKQNGCCAICQTPISKTVTEGNKQIVANRDHCHVNGHFCGLLCRDCNTGIGCFKNSPELFDKAKEYVKQTRQCVPTTSSHVQPVGL